MRAIADGVWQLGGPFPSIINAYLIRTQIGEVLIDAGIWWTTGLLLRELRGRKLTLMALTHVHPDHQGAAAEVCQRFGVPLACHEADADVMEGKRPMIPDTRLVRLGDRLISGPPRRVDQRWKGGESLGEWRIVHTPGHTPGHVVFIRDSDRVVIVGDVVRNISVRGGIGKLAETPRTFTVDLQASHRSMQTLLDLRPSLLCCGHGPPGSDMDALASLIRRLGFK